MQFNLDQAMEHIDAALRAPDVRYWVKTALTDSLNRNCVDAVRDAELLAQLLRDKANALARFETHCAGRRRSAGSPSAGL